MNYSRLTKIRSLISLSALVLGVATTGALSAHDEHEQGKDAAHHAKGQLVKVDAKTDAAWLAKAVAEYPTNVCVVSGDKLGGDMGLPLDYIYREAGKPDRLVRFCCKDCIKDFNESPAKVLGKIDEAAATKSKK